MSTLDTIKNAMSNLKPISFTYQNLNVRVGEPYAVFIQTNNTVKVHIVQTAGHTSSGILNKFKAFNIEDIHNLTILSNEPSYIPNHQDYKPESPYYKNVIAKV
ncbi:hypothetical protein D3C85_1037660 [compost metagenome]